MAVARELSRSFFSGGRIPLWVKILYTLFVAILVPAYWQTTPLVFLWFCNLAVLITLVALWMENSLLVSMQTLAIFWPHLFWQIDYLTQITIGSRVFKVCGLAPAEYMFDPGFPALNRCLSMQHAWMLYLMLWVIWRLGYDRRALGAQTFYAWVVLLVTYAIVKDMHGPAGNVNSIFGLSGGEPQTWMAPWLWPVVLMVFMPLCWYGPLHFLFRRVFRPPMAVRSKS